MMLAIKKMYNYIFIMSQEYQKGHSTGCVPLKVGEEKKMHYEEVIPSIFTTWRGHGWCCTLNTN